jgi:hypothetical protein
VTPAPRVGGEAVEKRETEISKVPLLFQHTCTNTETTFQCDQLKENSCVRTNVHTFNWIVFITYARLIARACELAQSRGVHTS